MALRQTLRAASGNQRLRTLVTNNRAVRGAAGRFVAGESVEDALRAVTDLAEHGLFTTLHNVAASAHHPSQAVETTHAYLHLLQRLSDTGLAPLADLSVKPTTVGLGLGPEGESLARENIARICAAARDAGTTLTLETEGAEQVTATLRTVTTLRREFPTLGCALQSYLRRTAGDAADMSGPHTRVRLAKGGTSDPAAAHPTRREGDAAFVRILRQLMAGSTYPMVATHDPRLIGIAATLAERNERSRDEFEYQMLYGAHSREQRRLTRQGAQVRVYVPYGHDWYGYLLRRAAARPAALASAARVTASGG
ncbi:L-proline dehydrogenase [Haloactinospora alba]|uniref:proline dehydrogenase n=1 Tax=Haloactinospora alba TaxID=405555 RepID=A0A543NMT2_9ACTN|nr:proline dehydrogenase family protein [Haloactinospora alba]TQN33133.1 L-proline dehydrogenase [Haloactinospora alba]